jgi:anti-sigma factor RsiW
MTVLWWRREVVCQQWVELVTAYVEGALPRRVTKAVDRHLAGCKHCREYLAQMRQTIRVTGELPGDDEIPPELLDALEQAFRELDGSD